MHHRPSVSIPESHPERARAALGLTLAVALTFGAAACSGGGGEAGGEQAPAVSPSPERAGPEAGAGAEEARRPPQGSEDDGPQDPGESFDRLDRDQDGYLRLDELPPDLRGDLEPLYRGRPAGDRGLTRDEFVRVVTQGPDYRGPGGDASGGPGGGPGGDGGPPGDPRAQFRMLDRNQDGLLRPDEFPPGQSQNFEQLAQSMGKDPSEGLTEREFVKGVSGHRGGGPGGPGGRPPR